MFPSQYLLLLTFPLAIVGVGASTILPRQQGCTLNPAGKGVSIQIPVNTSTDFPFLELATPSVAPDAFLLAVNSVHGFAQPDFHLQQNGQANPSYIITDVSDNSLALTYIGFDNGDRLTLEPISNSGNDP
ncbi:hypothetical protein D9758_016423 [Tetrapyrgos nigripes]|uniref:Uncharacterized protein n=1 Tax=Tetrapyrgos nigripes TaxID=182062 RepID=A0A8H5CQ67_9AGAR|nr:hypothetical protein D9758_016423 [Tetrapyrgos nigripes]